MPASPRAPVNDYYQSFAQPKLARRFASLRDSTRASFETISGRTTIDTKREYQLSLSKTIKERKRRYLPNTVGINHALIYERPRENFSLHQISKPEMPSLELLNTKVSPIGQGRDPIVKGRSHPTCLSVFLNQTKGNRWTYLPWTSSPTSVGTSLRGSQSRWDWSSGEELSGSGVERTGEPAGQGSGGFRLRSD